MKEVRDLLGSVPPVEIESIEYESEVDAYGVDGLIGLSCHGKSYALVVEVKSNGAPRFARSGVYQLESCVGRLSQSARANGARHMIPMFVSPYLSPESRAICTAHDVAYLDLVGNVRLAFDAVYIERAVADKPRSETRALRSIFTPKAAAILRVLLRDPDRVWRVAELAAKAKASYGHVSNVRRALLDREWLEVREAGAVIVQPEALMQTWRENYRRPPGQSTTGYTNLQVEPQYASDYDDRTTVAVKSVLVEIGQILGSYQGKFAVIGGAVPWLLLGEADMPHVGTIDVDLSLDAEALGDGEYAPLVETLMRQGYHRRD